MHYEWEDKVTSGWCTCDYDEVQPCSFMWGIMEI